MAQNCAILCLVACCLSAVLVEAEVAGTQFLIEQKIIYELFWRVNQPELLTEHWDVGKNYSIKDNLNNYDNKEAAEEFLNLYNEGLLPRGELFSIFWPIHLKVAVTLFKVFYSAKDKDILWKTAAWSRIYVNEGVFHYAFSIAVIHRPDTRDYKIPPYHEIYPWSYFNNVAILGAYNAKAGRINSSDTSGSPIIVPANYSQTFYGQYSKLNYYTEDVRVNDMHYYAQLAHPLWLFEDEYPEIPKYRGDTWLFGYRLQWVRYNMDRLSNKLAEVKDFDWNYPLPYGYFPSSNYHNGLPVPHREKNALIPNHNYKWIKELKYWEQMFETAIHTGCYIASNGSSIPFPSKDGLKMFGNMIIGSANSVNRDVYGGYDQTARSVLGCSLESFGKYKVLPSTLQTYGLDMRDPMYWPYVKSINRYYDKFVSKLPKSTISEMSCNGVEVKSVVMDKVITSFTDCDYLISGAVKSHCEKNETHILARQRCLTHNPVYYSINVHSQEKIKVEVRTFIMPRDDFYQEELKPSDFYKYALPVDMWVTQLEAGDNEIKRDSLAPFTSASDHMRGDQFLAKLENAIAGKETYEIPKLRFPYPDSAVLSKGTKDGFNMVLITFFTRYDSENIYHLDSPLLGHKRFQDYNLGWPLDRPVYNNFTELPNVYVYHFKNYFIDEADINLTV